jgi:hypothetical protein
LAGRNNCLVRARCEVCGKELEYIFRFKPRKYCPGQRCGAIAFKIRLREQEKRLQEMGINPAQ